MARAGGRAKSRVRVANLVASLTVLWSTGGGWLHRIGGPSFREPFDLETGNGVESTVSPLSSEVTCIMAEGMVLLRLVSEGTVILGRDIAL